MEEWTNGWLDGCVNKWINQQRMGEQVKEDPHEEGNEGKVDHGWQADRWMMSNHQIYKIDKV